jgi:hypothetical protein
MNVLYTYGKEIFEKFFLYKKRKIFYINDSECFNKLYNDINNNHINEIIKYLDLDFLLNFEFKFFIKEYKDKYSMKWHFDDQILFIHNIDEKNILNQKIIFKNKQKIYTLYNKNDLPIYTMIIYFNDYDIDFKGGEIEFIDKIYYPKKGMILFFDSRELHRVHPLKKGQRKCLLIKFYSKN